MEKVTGTQIRAMQGKRLTPMASHHPSAEKVTKTGAGSTSPRQLQGIKGRVSVGTWPSLPSWYLSWGRAKGGGPTEGSVPEGTPGAHSSRSLGARILLWAVLG